MKNTAETNLPWGFATVSTAAGSLTIAVSAGVTNAGWVAFSVTSSCGNPGSAIAGISVAEPPAGNTDGLVGASGPRFDSHAIITTTSTTAEAAGKSFFITPWVS